MKSHEFEICRAIYKTMRENHKAPSVTVLDLGGGYFAAETTDSKIINENLQGFCCKWAAKVDVLNDWVNQELENGSDDQ